MFKEKEFIKTKKLWPLILGAIILIGTIYIFFYKDPVVINNRNVKLEVLEDASIQVEEIWDVNIKNRSTLFITFLSSESDALRDIVVYSFENDKWIPMFENTSISSSGKESENHFHAGYFSGAYEIAWGTGLEYGKGNRKYKIMYNKDMTFLEKNSVNNYTDIGELYHKFVGNDFEIPIKNFIANIYFSKPINKDSAKIWGHGASSGEIHFNDIGGVIVTATNIKPNTMIEARVLFPKDLISSAKVNKNFNGEANILLEENFNTSKTYVKSAYSLDGKFGIYIFGIFYILAFGFIFILLNKRKKAADELPEESVRIWDVFSDIPASKLDFLYANVVGKKILLPEFVNTIIMKLSFNKNLNIVKVEELDNAKLCKNQEEQKNIFFDFIRGEGSFDSNKATSVYDNFIPVEKEYIHSRSGVKEKTLNSLAYVLDLKKYKENKLDDDEKLIMDFLISSITKSFMHKFIFYQSKHNKINVTRLETQKYTLKTLVWEKKEKELKTKLLEELDELYIEQYQILNQMFSFGLELQRDYDLKNKAKKEELIKKEVYSEAKEKISNSLAINKFFNYVLVVFFVYLLNKVLGPVVFNKQIYLVVLFLTGLIQAFVHHLSSKIKNRVYPNLTEEGLNIYYEIEGLKNFLSNSSYISEYDEKSIIIWGEFLVYATYFGVTDKVLKTLKQVHPEVLTEMNRSENYNTFSNTVGSFSSFSSVTNQTFSSASSASGGGGGGFSGGGGGGGRRRPEAEVDK